MYTRLDSRIRGAATALITPFLENGEVDFDALRRIVRANVDGGMDFLCVLGTTAETPTLTEAEQRAVRAAVVEEVAGRIPLIVGCGGNNTAAIAERMQSESFEGFDALLVVTPYYNKPNQEGLYWHFRTLAEVSPLPIILYNVPGRTGVNLLPETTLRIAADCPNVIGIKEASGNIEQIRSIINCRPEGFVVLSGDDALTVDIMEAGGDGVISVLSNARPAEVCEMTHNRETARIVDAQMQKYYKPLFCEGNPVGIKAMLHVAGMCENVLRLPLVPSSESLLEQFRTLA